MRKDVVRIICKGGIGILPTDTIYGLVGSALKPETVLRIYRVRKRKLKKPMIILIGSERDLLRFRVEISQGARKIIRKLWPGPVSIILPCSHKKFSYLHRGTKTLAFRLPRDAVLRRLLKRTGPLVAPSANREGERPATTIQRARQYFGDRVDFYEDAGALRSLPSIVVQIKR